MTQLTTLNVSKINASHFVIFVKNVIVRKRKGGMQFQNPTSTGAAVKFTMKIFVHFSKMGYADFEENQC